MASADTPREAAAVAAILRSQGASSFEPRVVAQLLEFSYRHTGEVLHEAQHYAAHRTRQPPGVAPLSVEDVRLAAQCSSVHAFTEPLGGDQLARLAECVNATPLPAVPRRLGLVYPANVALLAPTFQVLPAVKEAAPLTEAPPPAVAAAEAGPSQPATGLPGGTVRLPLKRSRIDALAAPPDEDGGVDDLRKASQFGVFEKKSNAFKVAREVLPPPPVEEQHMSRKLREFIQRQEALAQGKRPPQKQTRAPGQQKSAPPPSVGPVRRPVDQPSVQEAAGGSGEKRKRKKYESRKVREKRARREEVRQKAQEQEDVSRPAFGEVADAPPSLTLKVKRGQAPAGGASTGNRLGRLFEQQMKRAVAGAHRQAPVGPLQRREAQSREELRQSVIRQYRELRGTNAAATLPTGQRPAA